MTKITYIEHDGTEHMIDASPGGSVMEEAVNNGVPGIDADCGGACACATCHVYVEEPWCAKMDAKDATEASLLEILELAQPNSRLSCQIKITEDLDGLIVRMPQSQG